MRVTNRFWTIPPLDRADAALSLAAFLFLAPIVSLTTPVEARLTKTFGGWLESRIARPVLHDGAHLHGIIVLGGSPTRVHAALALAERFPDAPIILSGPGEAEISVARKALGQDARLVVDRRAKNTYGNALFSNDLVAPRAGECWAVVTSAVHMPRAIGAFQAVDFQCFRGPSMIRRRHPRHFRCGSGTRCWVLSATGRSAARVSFTPRDQPIVVTRRSPDTDLEAALEAANLHRRSAQ